GLAPSDLTVLNGEVLFRGLDSSGRAALWITDGTVAGTHELTGIAGASTSGIGLDPSGFAVYDGVALFSGFDSSGNQELWEPNGPAAGTTEIGPVPGTQSMGLFPTDLTAIGTAAPPSQTNFNQHSNILWQSTDGQAAIWEMNGTNVTDIEGVGPNPGLSWQ